ncbi:MAG: ParA family protein [Planctomycetota bacterium]|nr:MAG: ParA family protein [Planctomycetota bacterium]
MGRVITILNHKGGVGKTTLAVHLSCFLAMAGKRVMLYDLDPQGWAAHALRNKNKDYGQERIPSKESIENYLGSTNIPGLIVLWNSQGERQIQESSLEIFQDSLCKLRLRYDYIFLDPPPGWSLLHERIPALGNQVLLPASSNLEGLESIEKTLQTIQNASKVLQKEIQLCGIVITRYIVDSEKSKFYYEEICQRFGKTLLKSIILEDPHFTLEFEHGIPPALQHLNSSAGFFYIELVKELLKSPCFSLQEALGSSSC